MAEGERHGLAVGHAVALQGLVFHRTSPAEAGGVTLAGRVVGLRGTAVALVRLDTASAGRAGELLALGAAAGTAAAGTAAGASVPVLQPALVAGTLVTGAMPRTRQTNGFCF